jgi:hypothetical protein
MSAADHHRHDGFDIPAADPAGHSVNHELLSQFIGAALDTCASCEDALLTLMVEDPVTTAHLVKMACVSTDTASGGLRDAPGLLG